VNGGARQTRATVGDPHHVLGAGTSAALSVDEAEDVRSADIDGVLGDEGEERLQVVCVGAHGVGTRPIRGEVQELIDSGSATT
jgi:hypothetical protein